MCVSAGSSWQASGGKHPFDAQTEGALFQKILRGDYQMPASVTPGVADLIKRCLTYQRVQRPDTTALLVRPCAARLPPACQAADGTRRRIVATLCGCGCGCSRGCLLPAAAAAHADCTLGSGGRRLNALYGRAGVAFCENEGGAAGHLAGLQRQAHSHARGGAAAAAAAAGATSSAAGTAACAAAPGGQPAAAAAAAGPVCAVTAAAAAGAVPAAACWLGRAARHGWAPLAAAGAQFTARIPPISQLSTRTHAVRPGSVQQSAHVGCSPGHPCCAGGGGEGEHAWI